MMAGFLMITVLQQTSAQEAHHQVDQYNKTVVS